MKKILYLLLLSTMAVYFTGCKDKKDEEVTLDISEKNLVGKWSCYKDVWSEYGEQDTYEYSGGEYWYITFSADGTYKMEEKWKDEETNEYETDTENGEWEVNGKKLILDGEEECTIRSLTNKELILYDSGTDFWHEQYFKKI